MGAKKKKQRHIRPKGNPANKSTEEATSGDEGEGAENAEPAETTEGAASEIPDCPHINSANPERIKDVLKAGNALWCTDCLLSQPGGKTNKKKKTATARKKKQQPTVTLDPDDVWLCLTCGNPGCGRNTNGHAKEHQERSTKHALVMQQTTQRCWCYVCDKEIIVPGRTPNCPYEKVRACGDILRNTASGGEAGSGKKKNRQQEEPVVEEPESASAEPLYFTHDAPGLRGLRNLGNTCFFNSVMQNLVHNVVLRRAAVRLEPVANYGRLSVALLRFLSQMCSPKGQGVYSPGNLFQEVIRKAPRFRGMQQQDSHELFHYLIDGVNDEELKRLKLTPKPLPVPDEEEGEGEEAEAEAEAEEDAAMDEKGKERKDGKEKDGEERKDGEAATKNEQDNGKEKEKEKKEQVEGQDKDKENTAEGEKTKEVKESEKEPKKPEEPAVASGTPAEKAPEKAQKPDEPAPILAVAAPTPTETPKGSEVATPTPTPTPKAVEQTNHVAGKSVEHKSEATTIESPKPTQDTAAAPAAASKVESQEPSAAAPEKPQTAQVLTPTPATTPSHVASQPTVAASDKTAPSNSSNSTSPSSPSLASSSPAPSVDPPPSSQPQVATPAATDATLALTPSPVAPAAIRTADATPAASEVTVAPAVAATEVPVVQLEPITPAAAASTPQLPELTSPASGSLDVPLSLPHHLKGFPRTFIERVFGGITVSRVTCHTCRRSSDTVESSLDFSLPIQNEAVFASAEPETRTERRKKKKGMTPEKLARAQEFQALIDAATGGSAKPVEAAATEEKKPDGDGSATVPEGKSASFDVRKMEDVSALLSGSLSVEHCLWRYTSPEVLSADNAFGCEHCTRASGVRITGRTADLVKRRATKQVLIRHMPRLFVLHLKRFHQTARGLSKLSTSVKFGVLLDVAPFCEPGRAPEASIYRLSGVVEHAGGLSSGHYTAYIRNQDKWYYFSDSHFSAVSESQVLSAEAYLLFYEAMNA